MLAAEPSRAKLRRLKLEPTVHRSRTDIAAEPMILPRIENEDPHRATARSERLLPYSTECVTLSFEPKRPNARKLMQEPSVVKPKTEAPEPKRAVERIEMDDPKLQ
jgi:hypothetical protein